MHQNGFGTGHVVGGQLHHEGGGLAGEGLGLFEHDGRHQNRADADHIHHRAQVCRQQLAAGGLARHHRAEQSDDRQLCAAGHEGGGHDGQAAVVVLLDGLGGHDAGHAAAGGDHQGNEALAGKAEVAEDPVHHEGDAHHVAAVLQNGEEEEQNRHLGREAQNRAHAADDAVHHQTDEHIAHASAGQQVTHHALDTAHKGVVGPVGDPGAHGGHRNKVHRPHDHQEDGQAQYPVGHHPVNPVGQAHLPGGLLHGGMDQTLNVAVALIGDHCLHVVVIFLGNGVGQGLVGVVRVQMQLLQHLGVLLQQLDGVPALLLIRHTGGQVGADFADLFLNGLFKNGSGALDLAALGQLHGLGHHFLQAGALQGAGLHDGAAQPQRKVGHVDADAVFLHQVAHVQRYHHRDAGFDQLAGQVKVALDVGGIHQINDYVRAVVQDVIPGDHLFQSIGGQGVYAGQIGHVDHLALFAGLQLAGFLLHGNAGPVAHILVRAGQRVEHGGFAAVRVAGQCDGDCHSCDCLLQLRFA